MKLKFTVDHVDFFVHPHNLSTNQLIIKSHPKKYTVLFDQEKLPYHTINKQLKRKNILIIDEKILTLYYLLLKIDAEKIFVIKATEKNKTLVTVKKLLHFLKKNGCTKAEKLIVVGGGVTQEIVAFAAAIYKRGIPWVYFPTTLLSMSDSCIGGKASLNDGGIKNQLGLFSTPECVYVNTQFLCSLPDKDLKSGLGEILKCCILGGRYFVEQYQTCVLNGKVKSFHHFRTLIQTSLVIKKAIIEFDEFEDGHRRSLNYGHTFGHMIEASSSFKVPHGQAVAVGIIIVNTLSFQKKLLTKTDYNLINMLCCDLLTKSTVKYIMDIKHDHVVHCLQQDKKTMGEQVIFVMLHALGGVVFVACRIL
jgi:3-dehydroquinate synthase